MFTLFSLSTPQSAWPNVADCRRRESVCIDFYHKLARVSNLEEGLPVFP